MSLNTRRGFTLLELSIVLIIIALVTGMALSSGIQVVASARFTATQQKLKTIEDALLAYRTANDRLPCPGDLTLATTNANYGIEAGAGSGSSILTGTGVCTGTGMAPQANFTAAGATNTFQAAAEGSFPALSMNLPADLMVDGWGNRFRYTVDISMTRAGVFINTPAGCNNNAVTVNDVNGYARSQNALYALISHGENGHGAYTKSGAIVNAGETNTNELINCHCSSTGTTTTSSGVQTSNPATYVQAPISQSTTSVTNNFDDLVSFHERWQLQTPWDKASNCLYVAVTDPGNHRVELFNYYMAYIKSLGAGYNGVSGSQESSGTGDGQINTPYDVAIDPYGNFWVSDGNSTGNNRVNEYGPTGTYISSIGAGYNGVTGSKTSVSAASGGFDFNAGIAFDSKGNLWVADAYNNRLQEFSVSGQWLQTIPNNGCSTSSTPACAASGAFGRFAQPTYIAFDNAGNLWVNDLNNRRFQQFSGGGGFLAAFPALGQQNCVNTATPACGAFSTNAFSASGKFGIDPSGNLWINGAAGLVEFSPATGTVNVISTPYTRYNPVIDANGYMWTGVAQTAIYKTNTSTLASTTYGSQGTGNGQYGTTTINPAIYVGTR